MKLVAQVGGFWKIWLFYSKWKNRPRRNFLAPPWSQLFLMLSNINRQKPFRPEIKLLKFEIWGEKIKHLAHAKILSKKNFRLDKPALSSRYERTFITVSWARSRAIMFYRTCVRQHCVSAFSLSIACSLKTKNPLWFFVHFWPS